MMRVTRLASIEWSDTIPTPAAAIGAGTVPQYRPDGARTPADRHQTLRRSRHTLLQQSTQASEKVSTTAAGRKTPPWRSAGAGSNGSRGVSDAPVRGRALLGLTGYRRPREEELQGDEGQPGKGSASTDYTELLERVPSQFMTRLLFLAAAIDQFAYFVDFLP